MDNLEINEPLSLLPDLTIYGIEEVQPGVCQDTAHNRKILRENFLRWEQIRSTTGEYTDLILVITPEMREARAITNKSNLLTDPNDKSSDFLTDLDLLLVTDVEAYVPLWVLSATRRYLNTVRERERRKDKNYMPSIVGPPGRCRALRMDGNRCWNWHGGMDTSDGLCRMHVTKHHPNEIGGISTEAHARNRILAAALMAADVMETLADSATSESVKLQAAKEILDRANIRGGVDVNVKTELTVVDAAAEVRNRLERISQRAIQAQERERARETEDEVLYAEVVEDE